MDKQPDLVFSADELSRLRGPLVYVLWDCRKDPVYIGVGTRGAGRPFDPFHHAIGKRKGRRLEIYCCATPDEAIALERDMIARLAPRQNRSTRGYSTERGIRQIGNGNWQAYIRVNGRIRSKVFPADTPFAVLREWRRAIRGEVAKVSFAKYLEGCEQGATSSEKSVSL